MVKTGRPPTPHVLLAIVSASLPHSVAAGQVNGAVSVTMTVEQSCNVQTRPLVFSLATTDGAELAAQSAVTVACTPDAGYAVTMDRGRHNLGDARRLADASGASFLDYEIYRDARLTRIWGSTLDTAVGGIAPADGTVKHAVFARLTGQPIATGSYSDTITVTVSF